ncbi:unnamed protein product [Musa acuminata subsp. malaccensis]|uniref:(wild Malaysian banana) hypothetical protein n=1 Tax=Musa acuminata subsp. malaccensis TaxID=214687 RepID=A0A804L6P3_MUSAM|nr:unnamed protein product [Musa acuminata subsp. malaccensis]
MTMGNKMPCPLLFITLEHLLVLSFFPHMETFRFMFKCCAGVCLSICPAFLLEVRYLVFSRNALKIYLGSYTQIFVFCPLTQKRKMVHRKEPPIGLYCFINLVGEKPNTQLCQIIHVYYPCLPSHPEHHIAKRQMTGFGGVAGDLNTRKNFVDSLNIPYLAPSFGGCESIVDQPAIMSYWDLSGSERAAKYGIKGQPGQVQCWD